jgi:hypothetical protein
VRLHVGIGTVRAFGDCEIARRQATLATLSAVVKNSTAMAPGDRSALAAQLRLESSELAGLKTRVDSTAGLPLLRTEVVQIVTGHRIYELVAPKVYLTSAADGVLAMQPALAQVAASLAARIASARAAGRDVTAAQTALDSMNSEVAAAMGLATPLPGRLVPLTAAQWNAGRAGPVLAAARVAVVSARDHLRNAVKDGRAVIAALG